MNCEFWINYDGLQILCGVNTLGASDLLPEPPPFHHPGDRVTTVPRNTFHGIKLIWFKGAESRPPVTNIHYQLMDPSTWTCLVKGLVKAQFYLICISTFCSPLFSSVSHETFCSLKLDNAF